VVHPSDNAVPYLEQMERLFEGVGRGKRHVTTQPTRPAEDEGWLYDRRPRW
jgi:hypothetical protein